MKRLELVPASSLANVVPLPLALDAPAPGRSGMGAHPEQPWVGRGSADEAGWLLRSTPPPVDVTRAFRVLVASAEAGANPLPEKAGRYAYLLIGEPLGMHLKGYLRDNLRSLRDRGLEVRILPVDADAGVEESARTIREAVLRAAEHGRQTVLIGHGQGGVAAASALSIYPELLSMARAMVALQAPFGGSPVASDLADSPELASRMTGPIRELLRRKPEGLAGMTYAARRAFVAEHPLRLEVPAVCLATSRRPQDSALHGSGDYLRQRYGHASDGLVLPADAVLPGARLVHLEDMDHVDPVVPDSGASPRPAELTLTLVALALRVPPAAQALCAAA